MSSPDFLLDTNIVSDLVRRPQGPVAERIAAVGEDRIFTSIVVAAELRFGVRKSGSRRLQRQLDVIFAAMKVLPFEAPADQYYAELRLTLEKNGTPIGPNDLLIAAHAGALGAIVVTANIREFERVPGLEAENWIGG